MHKYGINIYWSDEDRIYIAEVPDLPGCITHGDTQESALANATDAIQLWIDTAKEFGDPIPEPTVNRPVSRSTEFKFKGKNQGELLHSKRKNNPAIFNIKRPQVRTNPKAH